jgi:hypothetical protein
MDLAESLLLAAALHVGLLVVSARWVPGIGDVEEVDGHGQTYDQLRIEPIWRAEPGEMDELPPAITAAERDPDGRERVDSRCDGHLGGSMGEREAAERDRRYGVQGTPDNPDPHLARLPTTGEANHWFGIGLDPKDWGGDPAAPMESWGRDDTFGNDPESARGHMWGGDIGMAFGSPGAGIGLRRYCETCGDDGRGIAAPPVEGTGEGGATGTERAGIAR